MKTPVELTDAQFDAATLRCQREEKVSCDKFDVSPYNLIGGSGKSPVLVVLERFLDDFFSTPLTYEETKYQISQQRLQTRY